MKMRLLILLCVSWLMNPVLAGDKPLSEDAVIINPDGEVKSVVIWLHGLGADGHDFEPIVEELGLPVGHGIRFVFPHAPMRPITINGGYVMRGWYDIKEEDLSREEDEPGVRESGDYISKLIHEEMNQHGLQSERILLAGFSQGGVISLHTALRFPGKLAGVMALSTYLGLPETLDKERHAANQDVEIFMAHGERDPIIAISHAEASRNKLESLGYKVNWQSYPMEHSVIPDEIDDIGAWLQERLLK